MASMASRALAASVSSSSISMYLPWRTPPTPENPRAARAFPTAFPWGSRTPGFSVTWTLRFHAPRRSYCMTAGPFMSRGPLSGRMPRRRATS